MSSLQEHPKCRSVDIRRPRGVGGGGEEVSGFGGWRDQLLLLDGTIVMPILSYNSAAWHSFVSRRIEWKASFMNIQCVGRFMQGLPRGNEILV